MRIRLFRSYRQRLVASLTGVVLITGGTLYWLNERQQRDSLESQLERRAFLIQAALEAQVEAISKEKPLSALTVRERGKLRDAVKRIGRTQGIDRVSLVTLGNEIIADTMSHAVGQTLAGDDALDDELQEGLKRHDVFTEYDEHHYIAYLPLIHGAVLRGAARVEIPLIRVQSWLQRTRNVHLTVTLAALLLGMGLATGLGYAFSHPLRQLAAAAAEIGRGHFNVRLPAGKEDEIGRLYRAFNRMAEDLQSLEDAQRRNERLAVSAQLASTVAHEIRNPLNALRLTIEHWQDRLPPVKGPARTEYAKYLRRAAEQIAAINAVIENTMDLTRPHALQTRLLALSEVCDRVVDALDEVFRAHRIKVVTQWNSSPPCPLDGERVRQVVTNLLMNAVEAMPAGGTMTLRIEGAPGRLVLSIQDTGMGLSPDELKKIFTPFFTTKPRGMGLGLAVVERIVADHGGEIGVTSVKGEGSTFRVAFPRGGG